jgi:F0F1-type ATP synthase assembly protein I
MNDPKGSRGYSTDQVGAIVRLALERQGTEGRISHDELLETAREIGVSAEDIEEAVAEEARIREAKAAREARKQQAKRLFIANLVAFIVVNAALFVVDKMTSGGTWFYWPLILWGVFAAIHAVVLIFAREPVDDADQIEAMRGSRRARIDEAFGAATGRVATRRPRVNRTAPPLSEDDNGEAEPKGRQQRQD